MNKKSFFIRICIASMLCAVYLVRFWLNAQGKPFWLDEVDGIYATISYSWKQLLLIGAPQASRSPLPYLLDKAWLSLWNNQPQLDWDMRVFFRILPATFWGLASTSVYFFVERILRKMQPAIPALWVNIIAIGASVFYYENSFMNIYAIETRAYSLWVSLSTLHFICLWFSLEEGRSRGFWLAYLAVCLLMVLDTYAALAQIYAGFLVALYLTWKNPKVRHYSAGILLASTIATFWYLREMAQYGYPPAPLSLYFSSVIEVLLKSFHHHGKEPALITIPMFLFIVPYLERRKTKILAINAFSWFCIVLSFLLYEASRLKGGIYASRYAIYLIPSFTWFYIYGFLYCVNFICNYARKHYPRTPQTIYLLLALCIVEIATRVPKFSHEISAGIGLARARRAYGPSAPDCATRIPFDRHFDTNDTSQYDPYTAEFESINDRCRGLKL